MTAYPKHMGQIVASKDDGAHAIGARLKEALKEINKSESDLADHLKISQQAVNRWIHGYARPKGKRIIAVCAFIGKTPEWLLFGKALPMDLTEDQLKIAKMLFSLPNNVQRQLVDRIAMFYTTFTDKPDALTASYSRYVSNLPKPQQ